MKVRVQSLLGKGRIPTHRSAAKSWLNTHNIPTETVSNDLRNPVVVLLSDLPEPERRAYLAQSIAQVGLDAGTYDDAAHSEFLEAPSSMRDAAERRAAIARLLVSIGQTVGWPDRLHIVRERFGNKGTSKPSLKRLLRDVKGVDPINYAPALLQGYKGAGKPATVSPDAWSFFMTTIRDAGRDFPLKQAWRDVRDVAPKFDWSWPSYPTVYRRWDALPEAQKLIARLGKSDAQKRLSQPAHRDKTTIAPLEIVSLDGRTSDFWAVDADGKTKRMTMLALVDVASNMVLDHVITANENARDTVRLIRRACEKYGIFDKIYTDNGSAFAGHLVAGGTKHKFRNGGRHLEGVKPLGICFHLGIELQFALPANGQAKIAERTFADFRSLIDDRPEFKGAHTGHSAGASPNSKVVPVDLERAKAVIQREINRYNAETGRRSQGAKGRSYSEIFKDGLANRIVRRPTQKQLYYAGLIYTAVAVDRVGHIRINNWIYGDTDTQAALLPFHGGDQRILLGRDPDNFAIPALAFDQNNRLICDDIKAVQKAAYDSVEGVRTATRNRKDARKKTAEAEAANAYATDAEMEKFLGALPHSEPDVSPPNKQVVGARFGAPLTDKKPRKSQSAKDNIEQDFWARQIPAPRKRKASGGNH